MNNSASGNCSNADEKVARTLGNKLRRSSAMPEMRRVQAEQLPTKCTFGTPTAQVDRIRSMRDPSGSDSTSMTSLLASERSDGSESNSAFNRFDREEYSREDLDWVVAALPFSPELTIREGDAALPLRSGLCISGNLEVSGQSNVKKTRPTINRDVDEFRIS